MNIGGKYKDICDGIIGVLKEEGDKIGLQGDYYVQRHLDRYQGLWYWAVLVEQPEKDGNGRIYSFALPDKEIDRNEVRMKLGKVLVLQEEENPCGDL